MKKVFLNIIGLVCLLALTACDEWLKVSPVTEVTQEDLLTTEAGFTDALTGVYVEMKDPLSYGLNLTMTTVEYMVSSWDVEATSWQEAVGDFNYGHSTVAATFENIYRHQYFIIANINSILGSIDAQKEVFTTDGLFEQIKGEALALRAYVHFDLLRMYGPVPGTENGDLILPYVTELSRDANSFSTYAAYKDSLMADLVEAQHLLEVSEQYEHYKTYRKIRMNEEAVRAMQARAYLWYGDHEQAFDLASQIIATTGTRLGGGADFTATNYALTMEQILSLHAFNLKNYYSNYFGNQALKRGTEETVVKTDLYGNTGTDIREAQLWEQLTATSGAKAYVIKKYKIENNSPSNFNVDFRRIPLIRLSEMYLIATEAAPDKATAQSYWDTFKGSRNLVTVTLPDDEALLKSELAKEYRKEFFAEGQAFYAYKRLNVGAADFLWLPAGVTINYVVPLPVSEIVNN